MNSGGESGCLKFCCKKLLKDLSSCQLMLLKQPLVRMQGNRMHGSYYPLSRRQLQWQISNSDVTKQLEKDQANLMQARVLLKLNTSQYLFHSN